MATTFQVNNADEFEDMITSRDFRISQALVNTILKNLKGTKRHHHALSVVCLEDSAIYDVTIDRKDFLHTLNENLTTYEKQEEFEECIKIKKAIEFLKKKKKKTS